MNIYPYDLNITFTAGCEYANKYYISCNCFNGLFSIDESGNIDHIGYFPNETTFRRNLHHRAFVYDNKIWFIPEYGFYLAIYNPSTNEFESIKITNNPKFRGIDSILYKDKLWIFSTDINDQPICVNLKSLSIDYGEKYRKIVPEKIKEKGIIFNGTLSFDGRTIWSSVWGTQFIYKFDLELQKQEIIDTGNPDLCIACVAYKKDLYFTVLGDLAVYSFDIETKVINKYPVDDIPPTGRQLKYCNILNCKDRVIILPETGEMIQELDEEEQRFVGKYRIPKTVISIEDRCRTEWRRFLYYGVENNKLVIYPFKTSGLITIDLYDESVSSEEYVFDKEKLEHIFKDEYRVKISDEMLSKPIIKESYLYTLERFLDAVEER